MSESAVTTAPFTSTPNGYVRRVAVMWICRWWWAVLLPVAACGVAAFREPMWIFVALMIVCLLYPALIAFIYFNYALTPEARKTVIPHTVTVSDKGVKLSFPENGDSVRYAPEIIRSVEYGNRSVTINLKHPRYDHIFIPLSAIDYSRQASFFRILETLTPPVA